MLLSCLLLVGSALPAFAQKSAETLTLQEAIERASSFSPKLHSARAGVDAARGSEVQAGLLPNPTASIEVENFGGTGSFGGLRDTETTLSASQLIELGGKRGARQDAASAQRRMAELEADTSRFDLVRDVTIAYFEAIAAEENLKLATELEATARRALEAVTRRVNAARDPLYQRSRAEVALTNATISRQHAANAATAAQQKLAQFWGGTDLADKLASEAFFVAEPAPAFESLEARLRDSPDLRRLDVLKRARAAELRLAEAGAVPDVTVRAGARRLQASRDTAFVAGISIPVPIFNQNQGEITRAGAEVTRAVRDRQQAGLDRAKDLIDAWTQWRTSWTEGDSLKRKALPDAERAYAQVLAGYRAGAFEYLEVLDTQRTLFETRNAYIAALSRLQAARAQVERLTATDAANPEIVP
ncbi:MAG: TolC family protein [Alphaproteobacteria bacterium]|nr:TolC family protein [Alphaproteobacteria bacterium]